jgi:hypothetical protein
MRPVEYGPHTVQCNAYTRPCTLADFPTAGDEQSFNVAPGDCSLNWAREYRFKGRLVFSAQFHKYHFSVSFQGSSLAVDFSASDWGRNRQLHALAVLAIESPLLIRLFS